MYVITVFYSAPVLIPTFMTNVLVIQKLKWRGERKERKERKKEKKRKKKHTNTHTHKHGD